MTSFPKIANLKQRPPRPIAPPFIKALPLYVQRDLSVRCDGDWSRVTLQDDGSIIVCNKQQVRITELPPALPIEKKKKHTPRRQKKVTPSRQKGVDFRTLGEAAWDQIGIGTGAEKLLEMCRRGLPREFRIRYLECVSSRANFDPTAIAKTLREPESVKVSMSTMEKKYPILEFRLTGRLVVLGFRSPAEPVVIATFAGRGDAQMDGLLSVLTPEHKRLERAPVTSEQLIERLSSLGAVVGEGDSPLITYRGRLIGKISSISNSTEGAVTDDWRSLHSAIVGLDTGRIK